VISSSGIPETLVIQLSPPRTGIASVNVPVEMISRANRRIVRVVGEQFDELPQPEKWTIEHGNCRINRRPASNERIINDLCIA
jgi:hypothetical protein